MSTASKITLHDLIIHKVDHLHQKAPRYSELKSNISAEVDTYLSELIEFNRDHEFARNGVFTNETGEAISLKGMSDELLKTNGQFVLHSQGIALHLFNSVKTDKRIHVGDLVICTFSEGDGEKWLGLLKMDPQDSFVTVEETIGGKRRFVLKRVKDVMPIGELQKCAFILPDSRRTKRQDLIVLDQQQARYGSSRLVASFFSRDFLQCKVGLNQRELTQAFLGVSSDWIDSKKGIWEEADINQFKEDLTSHLLQRNVNIVNFAHSAIEKEEEQDEYLEKITGGLRAEKLQDLAFKPDPTIVRRPQILQIEGDNNLKIRISSDAVGPDKTLFYEKDEALNEWIIKIRTTNLRTVYKQ